MKNIFRVVNQSAVVNIQRQDGTQTLKCQLVMQEMGGKYENCFVATLLGNLAQMKLVQNDLVYAVLRFTARDYNGQTYMDCMVQDIVKLTEGSIF